MRRIVAHARANAVAYLALFVALGGTSYAAATLPAGSVGTRQIQNGSVTPAKLNPSMIGGTVRDWAQIRQDGSIAGGSPGAHVRRSSNQFVVTWGSRFPSSCAVLATPRLLAVHPVYTGIAASVTQPIPGKGKTSVYVWTYANGTPTPAAFDIAMVC